MSQSLAANGRKYVPILKKLVTEALCNVLCPHADTRTIIEGVKKEKVKWVKKKTWPQGKALKIETGEEAGQAKLTFRMITDTSINNL